MTEKLTIELMREIAESRGGECLSKNYINCETNLLWRCKEGHIWEAKFVHIRIGHWCHVCGYNSSGEKRKLTLGQMNELAKANGGECLSTAYINNETKLKWRCLEGHEWSTKPSHVLSGHWCPVCSGNIKGTIDEMRFIAQHRGGECLSRHYIDSDTKLQWRCRKGHIFYSTPHHVKNGKWCRYCGWNILSIDDMHILAEKRGGDCLSTEYINAHVKLLWRCKHSHTWYAEPGEVKRGSWCPYCKELKFEKRCRCIFSNIFNKPFPKSRPPWLKNRKTKMTLELDGYNEEVKLAFEYNGAHHYILSFHNSNDSDKLQHRKFLDRLKLKICKQQGVSLIVIPYTVKYTGLEVYILLQLKKHNTPIPITTLDNFNNKKELKEVEV